jgi:hypothetical protein
MDTSRSDKMVKEFLAKKTPFKRKVQTYEQTFNATPQAVFEQFCPSREADWIDGWTADLIWTTTGYVEPDCIFTTPETNVVGPGLWIFNRLEPNKMLDAVRIIGSDVVEQFRIELKDNGDGTCTGTWILKFTAISAKGNQIVQAMPDQEPGFGHLIGGLEHFLQTGELMRLQLA